MWLCGSDENSEGPCTTSSGWLIVQLPGFRGTCCSCCIDNCGYTLLWGTCSRIWGDQWRQHPSRDECFDQSAINKCCQFNTIGACRSRVWCTLEDSIRCGTAMGVVHIGGFFGKIVTNFCERLAISCGKSTNSNLTFG